MVNVPSVPVLSRIIPLILLALWSVSPVFADDTVDAAVNRLSTVGQFAFGGVGYAGVISKGEIDFKVVVAQPKPTALNAYERLWVIGNPQGKSYALSGLKKLAPERFEELTATIAKSTKEVEVMRGCVISHEPLLEVAKQIGQGKFRFCGQLSETGDTTTLCFFFAFLRLDECYDDDSTACPVHLARPGKPPVWSGGNLPWKVL